MTKKPKGIPASQFFEVSTTLPKVATVTCEKCGTPWNATSYTVQSGQCPCGATLVKDREVKA